MHKWLNEGVQHRAFCKCHSLSFIRVLAILKANFYVLHCFLFEKKMFFIQKIKIFFLSLIVFFFRNAVHKLSSYVLCIYFPFSMSWGFYTILSISFSALFSPFYFIFDFFSLSSPSHRVFFTAIETHIPTVSPICLADGVTWPCHCWYLL